MRKRDKWLMAIFISLIPLALLFRQIMMGSIRKVCAKPYNEYEVKGARYIEYEYEIDRKKWRSRRSIDDFRIKTLDSLKKLDCFEIEYSTIWPIYTRITDKRVSKTSMI